MDDLHKLKLASFRIKRTLCFEIIFIVDITYKIKSQYKRSTHQLLTTRSRNNGIVYTGYKTRFCRLWSVIGCKITWYWFSYIYIHLGYDWLVGKYCQLVKSVFVIKGLWHQVGWKLHLYTMNDAMIAVLLRAIFKMSKIYLFKFKARKSMIKSIVCLKCPWKWVLCNQPIFKRSITKWMYLWHLHWYFFW